jgi:seryl-tRNA synthetase
MLDMILIREKTEWVKAQIAKLNDPAALERIDAIVALDQQRRAILHKVEAIKANRNRLNKAFGMFRGGKTLTETQRIATAVEVAAALDAADIERALALLEAPVDHTDRPAPDDTAAAFAALQQSMGALGTTAAALDEQVAAVDAELNEHLLWLPNLPHESVPVGPGEEHNIPHPPHGTIPQFDFEPKAHWDLGPALGIIDFERGVKLAGTRFYILAGMGARLHRALTNFLLDYHAEHGRTEVYTPFMVKEECMFGSAQFPKFRDVVYFDPDAELYLLPTAEVSVTNMYRDEILDEADLPMRYIAHTPCFRREKMSAGRDVRGIKRVHQFEKVEQYSFTTPDESYAELERIVGAAEELCGLLGLPYRRWKSAPATWASRPARSTTSRSTRSAARSGWKSQAARTPRNSRRGGPISNTARRTGARPASCTPSTVPAWPCRAS